MHQMSFLEKYDNRILGCTLTEKDQDRIFPKAYFSQVCYY